jgi:hypothetical protein
MSNPNAAVTNSGQRPLRERLVYLPAYQKLSLLANYAISYYKGRQNHALFDQLKTYCLFTGHARSGHSIVGALLDAHPNAVIADEVDSLRYVEAGFNRDQLCYMLLTKANLVNEKKGRLKPGRDGKTYSYAVPGQWQGRFSQLHVIGDTRAGGSTIRIGQDPAILPKLQALMPGVALKIINVVRNPFDNISTKIVRREMTFEKSISDYFRNCEIIANLEQQLNPAMFLMVRQEAVITRPQETLRQICDFVGLEPSPAYLDACAGILYSSPAQSRHKVDWTPQLIASVQAQIDKFAFLAGYTFES